MANQKVRITCDSTCDLSPELVEKYDIRVNPLFIVMHDRPLADGIEVTPDDLFDYTEATGLLPTTTAPNVQNFIDFFTPLLEGDHAIIHFTISALMSTAYNNARLAAAELSNVYVIDSKNLSTGSGLLVLRAAEMAAAGMEAGEIAAKISDLTDYVDASFIVDTLEYLHKGGRCSAVAKFGANLLKLKPCIEVRGGAMGVARKYRGKLGDVLVEYTADQLHDPADIDTSRIFITHTGCDAATVARVADKIRSILPFDEIIETRAGCTVSSHCGPGTLGVLFFRKSPLKA